MSAQAMEALAKANEVRMGGAQFRREVHAMDSREAALRLADELERDELGPQVAPMKLELFLTSVNRLGCTKVMRLLRAAGIHRRFTRNREGTQSPALRMRDLTRRERDALAAALRVWGNQ